MLTSNETSNRLRSPVSVLTNRPAFVVLVFAQQDNADALLDFLVAIPDSFEGSILLKFDADSNASECLLAKLKRNSSIRLKIATNTITLGPNQLVWLDIKTEYRVNAGEQVIRIDTPSRVDDSLIDTLAKHLAYRAILVLFDAVEPAKLLLGAKAFSKQECRILVYSSLQQTSTLFFEQLTQITKIILVPTAHDMVEAIVSNLPTKNSMHPRVRDIDSASIERIMKILRRKMRLDLTDYKMPPLIRRLNKRMEETGIKRYEQYADLLDTDAKELNQLYEDIFIGTTSFFRDANAFRELQQIIIRYLEHKKTNRLKIWSAGCSTGEETYSIAMLVDDILTDLDRNIELTIYATDIDTIALTNAQIGRYTEAETGTVAEQYKDRYMLQDQGQYRIKRYLKSKIIFSQHNLLSPPPFEDLDIICCRNLLIYFNSDTQQRVVDAFYNHLLPGGLIMLGQSESAGSGGEFFKPVSTSAKIYRALLKDPM